MAVITAIANGNWSSASTWDLARVPAEGDDVRLGAHTVTLDIGETPHLLAIKGQNAAGTATISTLMVLSSLSTAVITADAIQAGVGGGEYPGMIVQDGDTVLTINGHLHGTASGSGMAAVYLAGGSLVVNGSATAGLASQSYAIHSDESVPIVLNGDATAIACEAIRQEGIADVTVNGSVISGNTAAVINQFGTTTVNGGNVIHSNFLYNPGPSNYVQYPGPGETTVKCYPPFATRRTMLGGYES